MTTGKPYKRARIYLRPFAVIDGADARAAVRDGQATPLAGGPLACFAFELTVRTGAREWQSRSCAASDLPRVLATLDSDLEARAQEIFARLTAPRPPLPLPGGRALTLECARLMGVVNVTPDSFSDGGCFFDPGAAVAHARQLADEGADILDIGGESTRPGAEPVAVDAEIARVVPAITALRALNVPLSIDSRNAATMRAAIEAGAAIVNDVSALGHDPASAATVAALDAPVILMHAQGDPRVMQQNPAYDNVLFDVYDSLENRIRAAEAAGIARDRLIVDPGIGFGKTAQHNMALVRDLAIFHGLGCPILLALSRKSFIARLSRGEPATDRLPGSIAAVLRGLAGGAHILRVHDVAATRQAVALWEAGAGAAALSRNGEPVLIE